MFTYFFTCFFPYCSTLNKISPSKCSFPIHKRIFLMEQKIKCARTTISLYKPRCWGRVKGLYLATFRAHSWPCNPRSLLVVSGYHIDDAGLKPGMAVCKANSLPATLFLQPQALISFSSRSAQALFLLCTLGSLLTGLGYHLGCRRSNLVARLQGMCLTHFIIASALNHIHH